MPGRTLKLFFIYLVSATLGALAGSVVADHFFPEYEEVPTEKPIEGPPLQSEFNWSKEPTMDDMIDGSMTDMPHVIPADLKKKVSNKAPTDYAGITNPSVNKESLEDVAREKLGAEAVKALNEPYVISYDLYAINTNMQEKSVLTYYTTDKTLCDQDNVIVDNPDAILGPGALGRFGEASDDPDTVYIRDEKLRIDYEVVRIKKAYNWEVLKMPEHRPGRNRRTQKVEKIDEQSEDE